MIVYLIRNTANGRCYVGKTTGTLARRWKQHRCEARLGRKQSPLYDDMRVYQEHCFETEVLATATTQRRIAQLGRRFIRIFRAVEEGYNLATASFGARTRSTRGSYGRSMSEENKRRLVDGIRAFNQKRKAGV
ncbi:MAG: GIY-YIG nuclease family protein [Acidobacteriota bacterium]|nr:GIY-YIG nuclease family protein [Acidobacteriota bacterium]